MINPEPAIIAACDEWYGGEPWNVWQLATMDRAIGAALPHLLAAKDAEIAALTQERDSLARANYDYCTDSELFKQQIAALREAVSPLAKILCLIDDEDESKGRAFDGWVDHRVIFNVGKDRTITVGDLRRARDALEMSGGMK